MTPHPGLRLVLAFFLLTAELAQASDPQPPISRTAAEKTALKQVPGGRIIAGELETEHGRRIWSFDIARSPSTQIIEVQVDATHGKVVSVKPETPADEEKEKAADRESQKP